MDRIEIEEKVREIISDLLNMDEELVKEDSNFITDYQADSLDGIEIIMKVEDVFDVSVSNEEADMIITMKSLVDIIEKKLKERTD